MTLLHRVIALNILAFASCSSSVWDDPSAFYQVQSREDTCSQVPDESELRYSARPQHDVCMDLEEGSEICLCIRDTPDQRMVSRLTSLVIHAGVTFDPSDPVAVADFPVDDLNEDTLFNRECSVCIAGVGSGANMAVHEDFEESQFLAYRPILSGVIDLLRAFQFNTGPGTREDVKRKILESDLGSGDKFGPDPGENVTFAEVTTYEAPLSPTMQPDCDALDLDSARSFVGLDGVCRSAAPGSPVCQCLNVTRTQTDAMRMIYLSAMVGREVTRQTPLMMEWIKLGGGQARGLVGLCGACAEEGGEMRYVFALGETATQDFAAQMLGRPILGRMRETLERVRVYSGDD